MLLRSSKIKGTTIPQKYFRLLDLPAELRCMVYENIDFVATRHDLNRADAQISERSWPMPPLSVANDSTITLIRPQASLDILATCRIVRQEATPILQRKMQNCKRQPLRYLVDYGAAWALMHPMAEVGSCIGLPKWLTMPHAQSQVQEFKSLCSSFLSRTKATSTGVARIQITITHADGVVCGRELLETMMWLGALKDYITVRLEIVYETPLPKMKLPRHAETTDGSIFEPRLAEELPSAAADEASGSSPKRGVFMRPLGKDIFAEHMRRLEKY
jgi:hypothetical protein